MSDQYTPKSEMSVYLIRLGNTDYYKIGVSRDVCARLDALQTANPIELSIIASVEQIDARTVELDLHRALMQYRVRREWFECPHDEIVRVFHAINTMALVDEALDDSPASDNSMVELFDLPTPPSILRVDEREARVALYMRWRTEKVMRDTARAIRQASGDGLDNAEWVEAGRRLGI